MTTAAAQIVPRPPASLPALRAADQGVADALESVLSDNTQRVYGAQWRLFTVWCDEVSLRALPAEPLTVARYLAARANAHEWTKLESPCRDPGVRASLKDGAGALPNPGASPAPSPPYSPAGAAAGSRRPSRPRNG